MNFHEMITNIKCVEMGLPPLVDDVETVAEIIVNMESSDRKEVTRKIKKLCKKYITVSTSHIKDPVTRRARTEILEKRLGFKSDCQLFNKGTLERRIEFVQVFMLKEEGKNFNE